MNCSVDVMNIWLQLILGTGLEQDISADVLKETTMLKPTAEQAPTTNRVNYKKTTGQVHRYIL